MSAEKKKVLEMLAGGKITAEEAEKLLDKLASVGSDSAGAKDAASGSPESAPKNPRFLRIVVDKPGQEQVNVRLPLSFVNAGPSLLGVLPLRVAERLAEQGIDLSVLRSVKGQDLAGTLQEMFVDIEKGNGKKVRIFCE